MLRLWSVGLHGVAAGVRGRKRSEGAYVSGWGGQGGRCLCLAPMMPDERTTAALYLCITALCDADQAAGSRLRASNDGNQTSGGISLGICRTRCSSHEKQGWRIEWPMLRIMPD